LIPLVSYGEVTFRGKVIDETEGIPLNGVTIYIRSLNRDVYTDGTGQFKLLVSPGSLELIFVYPGYKRLVTTINVYSQETDIVIFRMERDKGYIPTEVQISAQRLKTSISRTTMTREDIETVPAGAGDVIRQFLGSIPGVALPMGGLGAAAFVVRGGEPEDNKIFFDNVEIGGIFHFGGLISIFNPESVQHIDFYAGGFPPGFGHNIGSVMDIKSTRMDKKKLSGAFDVSMITADFFIEGPIGEKCYFMASGRRSYFDLILPKVLPFEMEVYPFFWDIFAKLSYDPNQDHKMDLFVLGSMDTTKFNISQDLMEDDSLLGNAFYDYNFYAIGYNWKYIPNEKWYNEFTASWVLYNTDAEIGKHPETGEPMTYSEKDHFFTIRDKVSILLTESLELEFGPKFSFVYFPITLNAALPPLTKNDYDSTFNLEDLGPMRTIERKDWSWSLNGFVKLTWTVGHFKWYLGPEFHWWNTDSYVSISPRTGFEWEFLKGWQLLGAYGVYFQTPSGIELFQNSQLVDEQSFHYILGVSHDITSTTQLKVEGYFKHSHNLVEFDYIEILRDETTEEITGLRNVYSNTAKGFAYGVEVFLKQDLWNNFYGWISYTLSRANFKGQKDNAYHLSPYDQTHMLSLIASYAPTSWLQLSAKWRFATGPPFTSMIGRVRKSPQTKAQPDYDPIYNPDRYDKRYPPQHQLDFRVDFQFPLFGGEMNIYLEVMNVYNNRGVLNFLYEENWWNYDDPGFVEGLPILPYLGIEFSF